MWSALKEVVNEDQVFWYDHPIQIGVEPDKNEILYGLHHLSEALLYEKKLKNAAEDEVASFVDKAINDSRANSMKDMGKLMGMLKSQLQGKADMSLVSQLIKSKLS